MDGTVVARRCRHRRRQTARFFLIAWVAGPIRVVVNQRVSLAPVVKKPRNFRIGIKKACQVIYTLCITGFPVEKLPILPFLWAPFGELACCGLIEVALLRPAFVR